MSRLCSFDLQFSGERIALLSSDVFNNLEAQEVVTLVPRNSGKGNNGFTRSLTNELQSVPYNLRSSKPSFLDICAKSVRSMEKCNLVGSEFLAFRCPEIERAVSLHPHALRRFWGVQVHPKTAQCGVFNLHACTKPRRVAAVGVPSFFFKICFENALRFGTFVPEVLDVMSAVGGSASAVGGWTGAVGGLAGVVGASAIRAGDY